MGKIWENKHSQKKLMLLIYVKESQIQDLWNRESKSNINRSDGSWSKLMSNFMYCIFLSIRQRWIDKT